MLFSMVVVMGVESFSVLQETPVDRFSDHSLWRQENFTPHLLGKTAHFSLQLRPVARALSHRDRRIEIDILNQVEQLDAFAHWTLKCFSSGD